MIIHKLIVGPIRTNCYLLEDEKTKNTVIIDPGDEAGEIVDLIERNGLRPRQIIITHNHYDHTGAVNELKEKYQISNPKLKQDDDVVFGDTVLKIIETPGHHSDDICIVDDKEGSIFTGDTLFKDTVGRTDLPQSDNKKMQDSLRKFLQYSDDYKIYPGHGLDSTIGEEKENNPFLKNLLI